MGLLARKAITRSASSFVRRSKNSIFMVLRLKFPANYAEKLKLLDILAVMKILVKHTILLKFLTNDLFCAEIILSAPDAVFYRSKTF